MPVPSRRLKDLIEGTADHHASQRWPALEEATISWRGSHGYLTGYLTGNDDDTIKLCRIQYLGDPDDWAFAIWQASSDSYADAVLLDGHRAGHPNQALDTACTLYLADTGGQPAEPLKDLRGAALVPHTGGDDRRQMCPSAAARVHAGGNRATSSSEMSRPAARSWATAASRYRVFHRTTARPVVRGARAGPPAPPQPLVGQVGEARGRTGSRP